jgi:hypothetical protein
MAKIGDRVEFATARSVPRVGVVMAVTGSMVRVRWDTGGETSMVPGPGVLSVVGKAASGKGQGKASNEPKPKKAKAPKDGHKKRK